MNSTAKTQVLIAGAGPVGLTLAMDLASRGIDVTLVERRREDESPRVKAGQISARSMEIFRRFGLAKKLRDASGLPRDYPNDVVSCTTVTGIELSRVLIPSLAERDAAPVGPDTSWPTPEPPYRINQQYFEPVMLSHAKAQQRIRIIYGTDVRGFTQNESGVVAELAQIEGGKHTSIACAYLVGCDGARSTIRKAIGAELTGTPLIQLMQSTYFRAPALRSRLPNKPAWMYFSLNPRHCGTTIAIDGKETWLVHSYLYKGESEFETGEGRLVAIRDILGVDADFPIEVISEENSVGRRMVANHFRNHRVFICGDAAHLWIPHAGYGMNAGVADAANLSWILTATLKGWGDPGLLDAYEAERQPILEQASLFMTDIAHKIMKQRREVPAVIEMAGPSGDEFRKHFGQESYSLDVAQQCCGGLNFGYFYANSPIIAYDGGAHPPYTMGGFTSSTVPGCRAPHVWLSDGRSLYDALGADYTLLQFDPTVRVSGLINAAAQRGVPLTVLGVDAAEAADVYVNKLVLVRPDQHVAWRGDEQPEAPLELIDGIRGARAAAVRKVA